MLLKVAGFSHVGVKREQNQDHFTLIPNLTSERALFIVADGMGGHRGGETASSLAVNTMVAYFQSRLDLEMSDPTLLLKEAIQAANASIQARGRAEPPLRGMGTTTTALLFSGKRLYIGHVGDSRCYFARPNRIWQITRDHSLVQEKLRAGLISRNEVKTDRMKNVITRSVGFESQVEVDVYQMEVTAGDVFLICSDGLTGMLEDLQIRDILDAQLFESKQENALDQTVQALIDTANKNGGEDNVTAVLIQA